MVLDDRTRGILENQIDRTIANIPELAKISQREDFRKDFQIKEESDFMVGMVWGYIMRAFQDMFILDHSRQPNDVEALDAMSIVFKRTKEIREAIFKCG